MRFGTEAIDTYGTNQEALANLSILELEIFHAVLTQKTPHFFAIEPFNPSKELCTLLNALKAIYPGLITRCKSEEALQRIRRILTQNRWLWFTQKFVQLRTSPLLRQGSKGEHASEEDLSSVFLDGSFVPFAFEGEPNEQLINRLLEKAARTSHEPTKLVFLWAAVRHLSAAPYDKINDNVKFAHFLPLWDRVLSAWAGAAAWAGLHGRHLTLGRLPAVNALLKVREYGSAHGVPLRGQVNGAIASEYYSLAKRVRARSKRHELLNRAMEQLEIGLATQPKDPSGLLLIKGSVLLCLGRVNEAVLAYEVACAHRDGTKAGDGGRGEAHSELGFGYLRQGRLVEAQRELEFGVALLKQSNRRDGFTVRAMKKLGLCYLCNLHPLRALAELCDACEMALEKGIHGQINTSMRVIHWVCERLFGRKNWGSNWGSGFRCFDFDQTLFEPSDMPSEMFVFV